MVCRNLRKRMLRCFAWWCLIDYQGHGTPQARERINMEREDKFI